MVEVNRALYMDEGTGGRLAALPGVRAKLQRALRGLVEAAEAGSPERSR